MAPYPKRGEVIRINLNPTQGREQMGEARPCLVLSHTQFNQSRNGIVIVSPITSVHKPEVKTLIAIPAGYKVQGSIIAEQVRTLDLSQRWWRSTGEILPAKVLEKAIAILQVIVA
ncbi:MULTISPECIES: type II toxin-antitoxin system PemK/MazF family toxin [Cyanophyceae]|mgnify:CR=1 FL=1|uniref:type II toxin-antitoxin system PemK/MazF family toxin n=1 Tax=Cyanophyceae TaxID=3028117 RepID=UPI00016DCE7D|nr:MULTISPECIES: type II toxin-antitoxin system PemK/MazF family toxin [Cyanophyceae]ACB00940.1 transcriptional regulator, PemK family [Picosynechococcus sp. PCC 7002]SMH58605.1 mRNA interferase MazF/mRNA interferase ChpB [Picosynechococcus sp. OG1]SMQ86365.1 mRNA interferase MazF/mRNA interferase ChpB [Synechococcus sp. 7002]